MCTQVRFCVWHATLLAYMTLYNFELSGEWYVKLRCDLCKIMRGEVGEVGRWRPSGSFVVSSCSALPQRFQFLQQINKKTQSDWRLLRCLKFIFINFSTSSLREKCYGHSDTTHDLHEDVDVISFLCVTAGTTGMCTRHHITINYTRVHIIIHAWITRYEGAS